MTDLVEHGLIGMHLAIHVMVHFDHILISMHGELSVPTAVPVESQVSHFKCTRCVKADFIDGHHVG